MLTDPVIIVVAGAVTVAVVYYLVRRKNDPARKVPHEYFRRLWIWPPGSHTRWEAEIDVTIPGADKKVGFHSEALHDQVSAEGPTETEVAFCKHQMSNLNELFEFTKSAIAEAWKDWGKGEMPKDWTTFLKLDGFSVPKDGNINEPWGVAWFCEPAGHYFMIEVRGGKPSLASVDG
jgi:hypothetical protein